MRLTDNDLSGLLVALGFLLAGDTDEFDAKDVRACERVQDKIWTETARRAAKACKRPTQKACNGPGTSV